MEALKARELSKRGSGRRKKKRFQSRVKQFYSDFNSDESSDDSKKSSSDEDTTSVFTFSRARAPKLRPESQGGATASHHDLQLESHFGGDGFSSPGSYYSSYSSKLPLSPGLTKNQDMKDVALDLVYQRKIRDLKSITKKFIISDRRCRTFSHFLRHVVKAAHLLCYLGD